jgi:hypothetical protein
MADWTRIHAYAQHTYVQSFPTTSILLAGVSNYTETLKDIKIDDVLSMDYEPTNKFDPTAIVITLDGAKCGYVPKEIKGKIIEFVPSPVKVIDKHYRKGIYSLRVIPIQKT